MVVIFSFDVTFSFELADRRFQAQLGTGRAAEVIDLSLNGVRVTVMPTASSRARAGTRPAGVGDLSRAGRAGL